VWLASSVVVCQKIGLHVTGKGISRRRCARIDVTPMQATTGAIPLDVQMRSRRLQDRLALHFVSKRPKNVVMSSLYILFQSAQFRAGPSDAPPLSQKCDTKNLSKVAQHG
jgi:hypothetical protein